MPCETVKSPYVDYEYYKESFVGSKISKTAFPKYEARAEAHLHRITFGRVKSLLEIPDEVKKAICAMAEINYQEDKKTLGIRSENIDGYSVSYGDFTSETKNAELYSAAKDYLSDTGLLYRGRSRKYDNQC